MAHFINRRRFLQLTGSTFALSSLSHTRRLLAKPAPRKFALLVGINAYPQQPLRGCLTDIELQRNLLIHRFGFDAKDVLVLSDTQATRKNILQAFETHLIQQSKPEDIVVFHFSGYGALLKAECQEENFCCSVITPIDENYISIGKTLFLLVKALQTEKVTLILDAAQSDIYRCGNFGLRATSSGIQLSNEEIEYQNQWLKQLNLQESALKQPLSKGVLITAETASEAPLNDCYAGILTHRLTQYLWQKTSSEPVATTLANIARNEASYSCRRSSPIFQIKYIGNISEPAYFSTPKTPPAEAVIIKIEGNEIELWLGGVNPEILLTIQNSTFAVIDNVGNELAFVELMSRQGLIGKGIILNNQIENIKPGLILQERLRGIPKDISLKIGLDSSLDTEKTLAQQAFNSTPNIEIIALEEGEIDYILGKISQKSGFPKIGLFTPTFEEITNSFGQAGEPVEQAINRLQPKLKALLATKILKLALNPQSSKLNISATLTEDNGKNSILAEAKPVRNISPSQPAETRNFLKIPVGVKLQFNLINKESKNLYFCLLAIDSTREIVVLFPNQWTASDDVSRIAAGQFLQIPNPTTDPFILVSQEPKGMTEILIIASTTPLRKALLTLRNLATEQQQKRGPINLSKPENIIANLLDDLSQKEQNEQYKRIDITQVAAMSISFEII